MNQETINLTGKVVKDSITGFQGTCTGVASYVTGCDQVLICPPCKQGEFGSKPDAHWFDVNRIVVVSEEKLKIDTSKDKGPCESPSKCI